MIKSWTVRPKSKRYFCQIIDISHSYQKKVPQTGGLSNRDLLSHNFVGPSSKIKVSKVGSF